MVVLCPLFCYAALPPVGLTLNLQVNAKRLQTLEKDEWEVRPCCVKKKTKHHYCSPGYIQQSTNELRACKTVRPDIL